MNALYYSIAATFVVSIISFAGIFTLFLKDKILEKIIFYLVAISAGSLMGGAFLHLIPEAVENSSNEHAIDKVVLAVLAGFIIFFILEKVLHWHHCHKHKGDCSIHPFTYLSLIGDGLHNFIDGLIIVSAFSLSIELGIAVTVGVIIHEVPQELSDFGVLIYGGFTKLKALMLNFLSGVFAILGAICGFILINATEGIMPILAAITAGSFIYISASDLIPELHKETQFKKSLIAFCCFFVGISLMFFLKIGH